MNAALASEIAQWLGLLVMAWAVLGLYRHIVASPQPLTLADASGPPTGTSVESAIPGLETPATYHAVFLTESCAGCRRLIADAIDSQRSDITFVTSDQSSPEFLARLQESKFRVIALGRDDWRDMNITATPLQVVIDSNGTVVAKEVTASLPPLSDNPQELQPKANINSSAYSQKGPR